MTRIIYKAEIFSEGDCYVGLCRELDVSSLATAPRKREIRFREAVELFLADVKTWGHWMKFWKNPASRKLAMNGSCVNALAKTR